MKKFVGVLSCFLILQYSFLGFAHGGADGDSVLAASASVSSSLSKRKLSVSRLSSEYSVSGDECLQLAYPRVRALLKALEGPESTTTGENLKRITSIRLISIPYGTPFDFLLHFPNLESLDLRNNQVDDDVATDKLLPILLQLKSLTEVNLEGTRVGTEGVHALQTGFQDRTVHFFFTRSLHRALSEIAIGDNVLDLANRGLSPNRKDIATVSQLFGGGAVREIIRLDNNHLQASGLQMFLSNNQSQLSFVVKLQINNNGLGAEGLEVLVGYFPNFKALREISVAKNRIREATQPYGAQQGGGSASHVQGLPDSKSALGHFISEMPKTVKSVNLGRNNLNRDDLEAIRGAMVKRKDSLQLEQLILNGNSLSLPHKKGMFADSVVAAILFDIMKLQPLLQIFSLQSCELTSFDIRRFAKRLNKGYAPNRKVKLYLEGNSVKFDSLRRFVGSKLLTDTAHPLQLVFGHPFYDEVLSGRPTLNFERKGYIDMANFSRFAKILQQTKRVNFSHNALSSKDFDLFVKEVWGNMPSLTFVGWNGNGISFESVLALKEKINKEKRPLELQTDNEFFGLILKDLPQQRAYLASQQELDFGRSVAEADQDARKVVVELSKIFKDHKDVLQGVRVFKFAENKITDADLAVLEPDFPTASLEELDLSGNDIGSAVPDLNALMPIVRIIDRSPRLNRISLAGNPKINDGLVSLFFTPFSPANSIPSTSREQIVRVPQISGQESSDIYLPQVRFFDLRLTDINLNSALRIAHAREQGRLSDQTRFEVGKPFYDLIANRQSDQSTRYIDLSQEVSIHPVFISVLINVLSELPKLGQVDLNPGFVFGNLEQLMRERERLPENFIINTDNKIMNLFIMSHTQLSRIQALRLSAGPNDKAFGVSSISGPVISQAGSQGDVFVTQLRKLLPHMTNLSVIDFGSVRIGDKGARELAQAIPELKKLEAVYIDSNAITGKEGRELMKFKAVRLHNNLPETYQAPGKCVIQ